MKNLIHLLGEGTWPTSVTTTATTMRIAAEITPMTCTADSASSHRSTRTSLEQVDLDLAKCEWYSVRT